MADVYQIFQVLDITLYVVLWILLLFKNVNKVEVNMAQNVLNRIFSHVELFYF